jgi:Putative peptidoglycan binding domain
LFGKAGFMVRQKQTQLWRWFLVIPYCLWFAIAPVAVADNYNPVMQQVQTHLMVQGFEPGPLNGVANNRTTRALLSFQQMANLPLTGTLDRLTLVRLAISLSEQQTPPVQNWQPLPTQVQLNHLLAVNAYSDYAANAPGVNLNIPGLILLAAMQQSATTYGSYRPGQFGHHYWGYQAVTACLKESHFGNDWSDLAIHYFCQMAKPAACYSMALSGKNTSGVPLSRIHAYASCVKGELPGSAAFTWVAQYQPLQFQFVMFGQAHAFNHAQEQAVINTFYGVKHPNDYNECRQKRPRRAIDPTDGSHCQANKIFQHPLVGVGF